MSEDVYAPPSGTRSRTPLDLAVPDPAVPERAVPEPAVPGAPTPGVAVELRLDDQLCFALYTAASAVVRNYRPLLRDLGLTYPQYVLLMALWEHDGAGGDDELSVGAIAVRLRVPLNNVAPLLDRLEQTGLVERHRGRQDRRQVAVTLTDAGRALERQAAQAQHQVRCQTRLSPAALASLRTELHALTHALDEEL